MRKGASPCFFEPKPLQPELRRWEATLIQHKYSGVVSTWKIKGRTELPGERRPLLLSSENVTLIVL